MQTKLRAAVLRAIKRQHHPNPVRSLTPDEIVRLERWVYRLTRAMGLSESNAPLRAWCAASKDPRATFVVSVAPGVSLTVVAPPGTSVAAAKRMALERLAPALATVHAALVAYTGRRLPAHVAFVADKTFRRSLPAAPGDPVMPHHINGGLTTFGHDSANGGLDDLDWRVLVYRWSDALKVMIHELVHLHEVHVLPLDPAAEAAFAARHAISLEPPMRRLAIQESLTEVLALYVLSVLSSEEAKKPWSAVAARVGRESDLLASRFAVEHFPGWTEGRSAYRDGTHSYAYVIVRAALWTDVDALVRALESRAITTARQLFALVDERQAALIARLLRGPRAPPPATRDLQLSPIQ
jgi:hypothetical protein